MNSLTGRQRIGSFLAGDPVDRHPFMPITMMFAADLLGRSYYDYVHDYRVLVEAQLKVAETFDVDYVSCISDPTREASDAGAAVNTFEDSPPSIDETQALLAEKSRLLTLSVPDPGEGKRMHDRLLAAESFRQRVGEEKLIEGWVEGPCAEASDLRGINAFMLDFFDDEPFVFDLLEFVTAMEIGFARAQVDAGVDLIGIGDAAASLVGPKIYRKFVWPYEKRLVEAIHEFGAHVRLHICGNTTALLHEMGRLGCEIVDLDSMVSLERGRREMGPQQVLLGNLDPIECLLRGTPEDVTRELQKCRSEAGPRYIIGAGCEVPRGTPEANLHAMRQFADSVGPA